MYVDGHLVHSFVEELVEYPILRCNYWSHGGAHPDEVTLLHVATSFETRVWSYTPAHNDGALVDPRTRESVTVRRRNRSWWGSARA
jgi:hypothetical protein